MDLTKLAEQLIDGEPIGLADIDALAETLVNGVGQTKCPRCGVVWELNEESPDDMDCPYCGLEGQVEFDPTGRQREVHFPDEENVDVQ